MRKVPPLPIAPTMFGMFVAFSFSGMYGDAFTTLHLNRPATARSLTNNNNHRLLRYRNRCGAGPSPLRQATMPESMPLGVKMNTTLADSAESNPPTPKETAGDLSLARLALAGSLATSFADVVMHPLDSVKTLQQSELGAGMNAISAFLYLWHSHSLYFGFLTYAGADACGGALKFVVWETWKRQQTVLPQFLGAALAFVASSVCIVPGEVLKQQLQMGYYDTLPHAIQGLLDSEGVLGLYKGYVAIAMRDIPYTILELSLYDWTTKTLRCHPTVAAAVTGAITAIATTPLDAVKTKIVVDYIGTETPSFFECFQTTLQNHGPEGLFAGVVARVAWIVPFTMLYLPVYDFLKRILARQQER
jgi:hypothetical protein